MQLRSPSWGPPDDSGASQHRQREAHRAAEERVDHDQDHRGEAEVAQAGATAPGAESGESDQAHRRRPKHARFSPAKPDEDHYAGQAHEPQAPATYPSPTGGD